MKTSRSTLGRLLEEISWEGNARRYREGGRGFENVLTAEVFQALDFLPRTCFLGRIINSAESAAPKALKVLADQIEQTKFTLLPGDIFLAKHPPAGVSPLCVQPDGILESPDVYCLLEAKRPKRSSFQPEQLAREFLATLQQARGRNALLFLVLSSPPPISVRSRGQLPLRDAVVQSLGTVLKRAESEFPPIEELTAQIDSVIAFTTWSLISKSIEEGLEDFVNADPSVRSSISRIARAVLETIRWHS